MPLPLTKYKEIKDKYCLGCFGPKSKLHLSYLSKFIPIIQEQLPGIKICVACDDDLVNYRPFDGIEVIPKSLLMDKIKNKEFLYYKELKTDESKEIEELGNNSYIDNCNPVKILLDEAQIEYDKNLFRVVRIDNTDRNQKSNLY